MDIIRLELGTPFAEGNVNAYLVIGKTISLIDSGNQGKEYYKQLKSQLQIHGFQVKDIDRIVLSHIHEDHSGGVSFLQDEADIPVYVHERANPFVYGGIKEFEREEAFYAEFFKNSGAESLLPNLKRGYREIQWKNVNFLKDDDQIMLGGEIFKVVYVPGHSQTDILLWNPSTGNAFVGDHLLDLFSVNAFIEPPPAEEKERPKPLLQYRNSLERIKKLPLKGIFPGHGDMYSDHVSLIEKRIEGQEKRCSQILNVLQNKDMTILEISQEVYPRLTGFTIFFGLSQIQGHLDLLESREQVRKENCGQVWRYHAAYKKIKNWR